MQAPMMPEQAGLMAPPGAPQEAPQESQEPQAEAKQDPNEATEDSDKLTPQQETELRKFSLEAGKALYGDKGVAKKIAAALHSAQDVPQALADLTYNLTGMLDERLGGQLEDELLAPAAADVMGQLLEIGEAAGADTSGVTVAKAVQIMLKRFMTETGAHPDEVDQVMGNATPEQVGQAIDGGQ